MLGMGYYFFLLHVIKPFLIYILIYNLHWLSLFYLL
nr:MAG TPA: hypothetical protein [Caudoviricetes sp.]